MELITLLIAVYGAALSTLLAILSIKRDRRWVKITCRIVEQTRSSDGIDSFVVGIKAVNAGHRNVTLEFAGFRAMGGEYYSKRIDNSSVSIKDGVPKTIPFDLDDIEKWLRKISPSEQLAFAYVMDAEGTQYKTSVFPAELVQRKIAKSKLWNKR